MNPYNVLMSALQKVPFVKYALGVAGIAAAIAIIKSFGIEDYGSVPIISLLIMMGLMILLFVFAAFTRSKKRPIEVAGYVLIFTTVGITCCSGVLLTTSVFFDFPKPITEFKIFPKDKPGIKKSEPNNSESNKPDAEQKETPKDTTAKEKPGKAFEEKSPPAVEASISLIGTVLKREPEMLRVNEETQVTDELGEVRYGDPRCNALGDRAIKVGLGCFGFHRLALPDLPPGEWYANPVHLYVVKDNDGSWGWNHGNDIKEDWHINGQKANVTYRTGSRQITVGWKAEVWHEKETRVDSKTKIDFAGSGFIVKVPSELQDAALSYSVAGVEKEIIALGKSSSDRRIRFSNKTGSYYNYTLHGVK